MILSSTDRRPWSLCRSLPLWLGIAALFLAACGGDTTPDAGTDDPATPTEAVAPTGGPSDACALLPGDEVADVIGRPVQDSLALQMGGGTGTVALSQCNYATEQNPAAFSLMLREMAEEESVEAGSASARQTLAEIGVEVQEISSLGEAAFWGGNQLHVFTGNGWYLIVSTSGEAGLDQARPLAERALSRL